ncbi:hypothetical protein BpHYR1_026912 [Brachionus plicatilis]|uniref:Uncharacterized protein n=1 Tax=Brachionus plicatilis TaxID=10195 RepID=A0A3M7RNY9_BRAPC|nr:hypothetical protein BpHYR1_026912 [Brachionus plicatilis]
MVPFFFAIALHIRRRFDHICLSGHIGPARVQMSQNDQVDQRSYSIAETVSFQSVGGALKHGQYVLGVVERAYFLVALGVHYGHRLQTH